MSAPKSVVHVNVEHFDGSAEGDIGHPYFVANSPELRFTTDGATFEELLLNVHECVQLCLIDGDSIAEYGIEPDATVQILMELPTGYAKTA